ncbi:inner membrane protein YgaP [Rubritalea halochordaticola]|uniref:Inner membrane protein YgaP n=1 Tax=Rubritalea halochordaticola TaxID=714537 RepID=A0ABP9UXI0_9BACT
MNTIKAKDLHEKITRQEAGWEQVIDVRTPLEHREVHLPGAQHHPLDGLDAGAISGKEKSLYILCRSGKRAEQAQAQLRKAGVEGCQVIEGGILAWQEAGLPVEEDRSVMPLERQVRIAAGALVLLGAILGFLLNPAFYGLCAFVGAGLVFAGITNTCGMGMLIAKMPWNQPKDKKQKSAPADCCGSGG